MLFWPAHALRHYVPNFTAVSFIVTIISLLNNFFTALLYALDHCEVSISALVEVRFGGRSLDFYGMGWIWNQEKKTMSRIQDSVLKKASYP
jgi:hypothetical protein